MQTSPISVLANSSPGPNANTNSAKAGNGADSFNQALSREVADRRRTESQAAGERQGKSATEQAHQGKPAKPVQESKPAANDAPDGETSEAAAQSSAEMLALVSTVAQLRTGEVKTKPDGELADAEEALGPNGKRKHNLPFVAQHAAIGGRVGDSMQSKPDGTWPAHFERGSTGRMMADEQAALAVQTGKADSANTLSKAVATTDFGTALKDASQLVQPLQQQPGTALESLANQVTDKLSPRVGSPGWDQALGQKIVWMAGGEQQSASLTLNPPDLGPLKVVLQLTNTQATATFVAAQPEVRQALEAAMPRLREMLEEAGIHLGQASVDSGSPDQQHPSERNMGRPGGLADDSELNGTSAAGTGTLPPATSAGIGLVDTFV